VTGLEVSGLKLKGPGEIDLKVTGLQVSGLQVSGLKVAGLQVVERPQG